MIKGFFALFSTNVIFNPFVLAGIAFGFYLNANVLPADLKYEFSKPALYILVLILACVYNIFFKKHLILGGYAIDWGQTAVAIAGSFVKFFIASVLTLCFINFLFF